MRVEGLPLFCFLPHVGFYPSYKSAAYSVCLKGGIAHFDSSKCLWVILEEAAEFRHAFWLNVLAWQDTVLLFLQFVSVLLQKLQDSGVPSPGKREI